MKRRKGYTRLSRKNQVTLPVDVVAAVGLRPGDELRVEAEDGHIVLEPAMSLAERRLAALESIGDKYAGMYPPGYLEQIRREWRG